MKHIFHLGRDAELSILEVVSYLKRTDREYEILKITKKCIQTEIKKFDTKKAINALGGTIKISSEVEDSEEFISRIFSNLIKSKVIYATNEFESSDETKEELVNTLKQFAKEQKLKLLQKHLTEKEIPPSKSKNLDFELTLFKNKLYKVSAVSDPKGYKARDEERPNFDPLRVTSIRLAKILINLAQPTNKAKLLIPYTGLGTISQEAYLMGIESIGIEENPMLFKRGKQNIKWLKDNFKSHSKISMKQLNLHRFSKELKNIDCIATEPDLGPYLRKLPTESEARELAKSLSRSYDSLLQQASKLLKKGSKISIVVPNFKTRNSKIIRIGFQSMLKKHGFEIYQPLDNTLIPIDYKLKNSKIKRKIYVLEKLK